MPKRVDSHDHGKDIWKALSKLQSQLQDLTESTTGEISCLKADNAALKQQCSALQHFVSDVCVTVPDQKKINHLVHGPTNLVLGSSHVSRLQATDASTKVVSQSGGKRCDAKASLVKLAPSSLTSVTLVTGSNNCDSDQPTYDIILEFCEVINEAKRVAESVTISSILPRLTTDDYSK